MADSVNPSALVMTMVLLGITGTARAALIYIAGIAVTYSAIGLTVAFGLGDTLRSALAPALAPSTARHAAELAIAVVLAGWAVVRLLKPPSARPRRRMGAAVAVTPMRLLLTGATLTAVEATTALPYVGALGLLIAAEPAWTVTLAVVLVYNVIFVAPPLVLVALFASRRETMERLFSGIRARIERTGGGRWVTALLLLGAALLAADGADGLATGDGWL